MFRIGKRERHQRTLPDVTYHRRTEARQARASAVTHARINNSRRTRIQQLVENTPDYPDFQTPGAKASYMKWLESGTHLRPWDIKTLRNARVFSF